MDRSWERRSACRFAALARQIFGPPPGGAGGDADPMGHNDGARGPTPASVTPLAPQSCERDPEPARRQDWSEEEHPRAPDGKFGSGGGSSAGGGFKPDREHLDGLAAAAGRRLTAAQINAAAGGDVVAALLDRGLLEQHFTDDGDWVYSTSAKGARARKEAASAAPDDGDRERGDEAALGKRDGAVKDAAAGHLAALRELHKVERDMVDPAVPFASRMGKMAEWERLNGEAEAAEAALHKALKAHPEPARISADVAGHHAEVEKMTADLNDAIDRFEAEQADGEEGRRVGAVLRVAMLRRAVAADLFRGMFGPLMGGESPPADPPAASPPRQPPPSAPEPPGSAGQSGFF